MAEPRQIDERLVAELLAPLRDDEPEAPPDLPDRTVRKVQAVLTARDLIDLTTMVFVLRFCAPLIDLIAAFFGRDETPHDRRPDHG